ncbi:hypothetical protein Slin15195_G041010 [Septoria linicola]|uniref:Uncharacterized protein n=1 Tax=Septoria linicola TaxID=215465 RepID=A0A9Q9AJZ8_9PEZI|nr:hypothetical protein Slin14017_G044540 [Septoria linicola]USW50782.1 hypothetical protein Slin15195_G041010 [Septoria linicola]
MERHLSSWETLEHLDDDDSETYGRAIEELIREVLGDVLLRSNDWLSRNAKVPVTCGHLETTCSLIGSALAKHGKLKRVKLTDCRCSPTKPRKYGQFVRKGGLVLGNIEPENAHSIRPIGILLSAVQDAVSGLHELRIVPGRWALPVGVTCKQPGWRQLLPDMFSTLTTLDLVLFVEIFSRATLWADTLHHLKKAVMLEVLSIELLATGPGYKKTHDIVGLIQGGTLGSDEWELGDAALPKLSTLSLRGGKINVLMLQDFVIEHPTLINLGLRDIALTSSEDEWDAIIWNKYCDVPDILGHLEISTDGEFLYRWNGP